jgi:DNA-binding CsgD family transcriptional regulator
MAELDQLSNREQDVVKLLLQGKSNKMIAASLHISERTVEFHLKNIYTKYQVSSRMELVLKLGESTVADAGQGVDNKDWLNPRNWAAFLREGVAKINEEIRMTQEINASIHSQGRDLKFHEAIRTCIVKYAEFDGRASRSEFWWFMLFVLLSASALAYLNEVLVDIFLIGMLLPILAAGTRRLRDSDKSGWWQLFLLAPVAGIVVLGYLWALPPANPHPDDALPT